MEDQLGIEVAIGDFIAFAVYGVVHVGLVVSFTDRGNPRVLEYDDDMPLREDAWDFPFCMKPKAVGINSGFVKMSPPTNNLPPL